MKAKFQTLTRELTKEVAGTALSWNRSWFVVLVLTAMAQFATIFLTWPLWQVRTDPPNLPMFDLPQISTGWLIVGCLLLILFRPAFGAFVHAAAYSVACLLDQTRLQPQFLGMVVLLLAVAVPGVWIYGRWYLISLWFWSGLHKLLSPDWFAYGSWLMLDEMGIPPEDTYLVVAWAVGLAELLLGIVAIFRPRSAAIGCVVLHVGIAVHLLPWFRDWNYSVIPWNLATAVVGFWLLRNVDTMRLQSCLPLSRAEWLLAAILLILPSGFYLGIVDHCFAHVLYSDNVPTAAVTNQDGTVEEIVGWGDLAVPFPHTPRLFRQYFVHIAEEGEKLHIRCRHPQTQDFYYQKEGKSVVEISSEEFYQPGSQPVGIGFDSARSVSRLAMAGARLLKRREEGMVYAVEIPPEVYSRELLDDLLELPNLEQLQLAGTAVRDEDLHALVGFPRLWGIGLEGTQVTDRGIMILKSIPTLQEIHYDDSAVSETAIKDFLESRPKAAQQ